VSTADTLRLNLSKADVWVFRYVLLFILIALFAIHPVLVSILAGFIARGAGCPLDEGGPHPCVISGHDYGSVLYDMGVYVWAIIFSVFAAQVAVGLMLAIYLTRKLLRKRGR
jgi:hypothetical protein